MPRVENCGPSVDKFCGESGNGSSTHDVCVRCAEDLEDMPHVFDDKLKPYNGDPEGEDGWKPGVDHPPYNECNNYVCAVCLKPLTDEDD